MLAFTFTPDELQHALAATGSALSDEELEAAGGGMDNQQVQNAVQNFRSAGSAFKMDTSQGSCIIWF